MGVNATSLLQAEVLLNEKPASKIKILHIDDDPYILEVSKQILELESDFEVETALSVDQAFGRIEQQSFDVVISDYEMPKKNGLQFLKELRQQKNEIPFILFTGKGREEVAITALNLGADGYYNKQGSPETVYGELSHGIRLAVSRRKAEEALKASEENYCELINGMNDTAWVIDFEANFVDVNDAAVKVLGYSREELLSMGPSDIDNTLSKEQIIDLVRRMPADQIQVFETTHTTKDGKTIPVEISSSLVTYRGKQAVLSIARNITERKQAAERLKKEQRELDCIVDSSPIIIFYKDKEGKFIRVNKTFAEALKIPKEEFLGKTVADLYSAEIAQGMTTADLEVLKSGRPKLGIIEQYESASGMRWVQTDKVPIFENNGIPVGLVGFSQDITEQKKVEEALQAQQRILSSIYGNVSEILFSLSVEPGNQFRFISVNQSFLNATGLLENQVVGKSVHEVIPEPSLTLVLEKYAQAVREKKTVRWEEVTDYPAGRKHGEVTVAPVFDSSGRCTNLIGNVHDITERKLMDTALHKSSERFKQVMEHVEEFVWEVDAAGVYTYANSVVEKILGYTPEEVVGKKCFYDFFHPDDREEMMKAAFSVFNKKESFKDFPNRNVHKNGSIVWLSTSGIPIVDDDGKLLGYRGVDVNITERTQTEAALKESEDKYRSLFANMPNGFAYCKMIFDEEGKPIDFVYLQVNNSFKEVTGLKREAIVGKKHTEMFSETEKASPEFIELLNIFGKVASTGKEETFEVFFKSRNIWLNISVYSPEKDYFVALFNDITELKKVMNALGESEEKYRRQFEEALDAIFVADIETGILVDCNPAACELVGRAKSEIVGMHQRVLHPPEETEGEFSRTFSRAFKEHLGKKKGQTLESQVITKSGEIKDVAIKASIFTLGSKSLMQGSFRDITEQKKVEKALREAEEKYRETIINANVGIIAYDPKSEVKILNPKMEEMTGFTRREIPTLAKWFEKLYPNEEERRKIRDKWFKRMSEEGEVKDGQAMIMTKEGKNRNFLFNGFQLKSGDFIALAQDITERKEAEKKLDELMNELVMVNEKLGVVGSLTRHDVRNKLCAVTGNIFLLKKKYADQADVVNGLVPIEKACKEIQEIFAFAKTYEQLGIEELTYIDAERALKEAIDLFSGSFSPEVVNDCSGLTLLADSLLRQLFYNLIDNSLKHGVKVTKIRVHYEKVDSDRIILVYEDDGVGISAVNKQQLFKEGFSTSGSSGYGLSLIRKMMNVYGWMIKEDGEHGQGVKFIITVPRLNQNGKINFQIAT